jgi:muconate cycloisomerase
MIPDKRDRIRCVEAIPAKVRFRSDFRIGRGAVGSAGGTGDHVFVRIETESGRVGWGETRALPSWSYETVESIVGAVRGHLAPLLLGLDPFELLTAHRRMYETLTPSVSNGQPFVKSAIDIALHDLMGQIAGVPIHALLGGRQRDRVELTFALSIADPEEMAAAAASFPACRCFKVKIAGDERDLQRIRAVAEARPAATLWLDANQSYPPARAIPLAQAAREIPAVFCLEQPVRSVDWFGMRQVRERSPLPVAIDEGAFSAFDVARVATLRSADLIVLKVSKSGGLRECLRSAAVAEAHGMGLLGSGLTESGIGLVASVHLFSTLETLLPPELNGVEFLDDLFVEDLEVDGATVRVPDRPGLGVRVDEAKIRDAATEGSAR